MLRPLSTLPLSETALVEIGKAGYYYVDDVKNAEGSVGNFDVRWLDHVPIAQSALDLWQEELQYAHLTTFCGALDNILDGGFQCKEITEICGAHGSGKSQICMQISIATQLPKECGGLNSHSLYIDTRNGFSPTRVFDMIKGCQRRFPDARLDAKEILKGINVVSPRSLDDLLSVVDSLKHRLTTDSRIRVVIVDSLSLSVQCSLADGWQRTQIYFRIFNDLQKISARNNVAVIVVNELRSHVDAKGEIVYASAGGQLVAHRANKIIVVARLNDFTFAARILKSSTMPQISVTFGITENGIRDIESKSNRRSK